MVVAKGEKMPADQEKMFSLSYKLEVLRPGLTREQVREERKRSPGTGYCHAALVLALMGDKALIVTGTDTRGVSNTGSVVSGQNQFDMWMMFAETLRGDPSLPHAMRIFIDRVVDSYHVQVGR